MIWIRVGPQTANTMGRKRESHVSTLDPRDEVKLEGVKRA